MKTLRIAAYARVSTNDQNTENQLIDLRRFSEQRGWMVVKEYVDQGISGTKERRPALDELMADARRRRFDAVVVWKFDRFARSAQHLLNALAEFKDLDIDFCSIQDAVDTSTAYGKAMFTIIGAMAELERELIRQRVKNGVQKARERGRAIGRPKVIFDLVAAQSFSLQGHSNTAIGRHFKVSRETVRKALAINPPSNPQPASVEA